MIRVAKNIIYMLLEILKVISPAVTCLIAIYGHQLVSPSVSTNNIRTEILKSECSFPMPSKEVAIERKDLQQKLEKFLDLDGYQPNPLTRVVCGPRGSGKTAAVINLLKGRKGVVYVHIRESDDTYLAQQILRTLSVSVPQGTDPTCLLGAALQDIQKWSSTPSRWFDRTPQDPGDSQPILVVDFNPRVGSKSFEDILFLLKSWGSDSGWVKPIIILTGTLGLHKPRLELRAKFFKVDDLSPEECALYHAKMCKMIDDKYTDQCKSEISKILPPDRWNQLLHLSTLAQSKFSSLDELKKEATLLKEEIIDSYEKALISFTKEIEKKTYSEQHHVLCKLMNEEKVNLKDFCVEYNLPEKDIIEILLAIRPRPFYVHPQTGQVYIGSRFMMPALECICNLKY